MKFLIAIIFALLFSFVLRKSIKKHAACYYVGFLAIAIMTSLIDIINFPKSIDIVFSVLFQYGTLSAAFFTLVMYMNAFKNGSIVQKTFMPIRAELSIIACILAYGHVISTFKMYFLSLINQSKDLSVVLQLIAVIGTVLIMTPLFVTSFKAIRKRMNAANWKKLQRLAYAFYSLVYLHVILLMVPRAFEGNVKSIINVVIYSLIFLTYGTLRLYKFYKKTNRKIALTSMAAMFSLALIMFAGYTVNAINADNSISDNKLPLDEINLSKYDIDISQFEDGIYKGTGTGFRGDVKVSVTVKDGKITEINIDEYSDDEYYMKKASVLKDRIINAQSINVDVVSRATYSSNGIKDAVLDAFTKNKIIKVSNVSKYDIDVSNLEDGVYKGTGTGFRGNVKVSVTVKNGKITEINIDQYSDDEYYMKKASVLKDKIINAQSVDVDVVSRATYSSNGIKDAVLDALTKDKTEELEFELENKTNNVNVKAKAIKNVIKSFENNVDTSELKDGIYKGTGTGFRGDIKVSVTIQNGKISKIVIDEHCDDEYFMNNALAVKDRIINAQSVDVDVVSRATYSSNGIKDAVSDALRKAKEDKVYKENNNKNEVITPVPIKNKDNTVVNKKPKVKDDVVNKPIKNDDSSKIVDNSDENETKTKTSKYDIDVSSLEDGIYKGTGTGFKGDVKVSVTIQNGKIAKIDIDEHCDDEYFMNKASALKDNIVDEQDVDIDVVSGATYSSNGIKDAVLDALTKEKVANISKYDIDVSNLEDGIYKGTGTGFKGDVKVSVTVKDGKITKIYIDEHCDDEYFMNKASALKDNIVDEQDVDIDVVSGATYSSNGIKDAVLDALIKEKVANISKYDIDVSSLEDGIYKGTGTGFKGDVKVSVTVKDGKITKIDIDEHCDDEYFMNKASDLKDNIVDEQNVNIDVVSGATYSSNGIKDAVLDALTK